MTSVGQLFVSLGFDVDTKKLDEFKDGIKTAQNEILKLSAIATTGVLALGAFFEGSVSRALGIKNFVTETGQASEGLQRFQSVVNQVNASISTSEAGARYRALANAMTDISQAGGGGSLARLTGGAFHIGMKEEDVIEAIRNYKQKFIQENGGGQIGIAAHARLLDQIGLGAGTERAFDVSREKYNQMSDPFVRSQEFIEKGAALGNAISLLQQKWDKFRDDLLTAWAPKIIQWLDQIERSLQHWIPVIMQVVDALGGLQKVGEYILIYFAGKWALGMIAAIVRVGLAFAGLGTAALAAIAPVAAVLGVGAAGVAAGYYGAEKSGLGKWIADLLVPPADSKKPMEHLIRNGQNIINNTVTQNVTAQISTTANAKDLVDNFMRQNQQSINRTLLSVIGKPVY